MSAAQRSPGSDGTARLDPIVVISPHLDDGVFACGRLLASHPGSVVITVFAGKRPSYAEVTPWDALAGFAPGEDVVAARREEDRRALGLLAARPVWLPFLDSQYGETPTVERVAESLQATLEELGRRMVLAPLGVFHSDHLLASEAALAVAQRLPDLDWHLYADAIYRRITHLFDERVEMLQAREMRLQPASLAPTADHAELKRRAVECYRSQLRALASPGKPGFEDAARDELVWQLQLAPARGQSARMRHP